MISEFQFTFFAIFFVLGNNAIILISNIKSFEIRKILGYFSFTSQIKKADLTGLVSCLLRCKLFLYQWCTSSNYWYSNYYVSGVNTGKYGLEKKTVFVHFLRSAQTHFVFDDKSYKQFDRVVIYSPLVPVRANTFMN